MCEIKYGKTNFIYHITQTQETNFTPNTLGGLTPRFK